MPRSRSAWTQRAESKWTGVVRRFRASGLNSREFCRRHGVALSSLERWHRRLKPQKAGASGFVELVGATAPTPAPSPWSVEIVLPNGACLRFRK